MTAILELSGVTRRFGGVAALSGAGFAVGEGEVVALIGPNGAGKTTCFNVIDGTLRPDAGEVRFAGARITGLAPEVIAHRGIGRTFQVASTFGSMTVRESVAIAAAAHARRDGRFAAPPLATHSAPIDALLAAAGIAALADQVCATLAWGDAKRVELALVRAGSPRLLLLDEPAAGLEPDSRRTLMQQASALARNDGVAVLFTEHDMDVVFGFADRIVVLNRGAVIADGPPAAIRASAEVAEAYLGSAAPAAAKVDTPRASPSMDG
ncbi:MAG: ATP-binding cassette domain-containing protein [Proteobacteria bacterium]|jgi:branched-chain amino acid transport system ATP-binding protein|nr:ATP-binding cassette domain-containing protein [Pseudomonadota bacterium]